MEPENVPAMTEGQQQRRGVLEKEYGDIQKIIAEVKRRAAELPAELADLGSEDVTEEMVNEARTALDAIELYGENTEMEVLNSARRIEELQRTIRELQTREQLLRNPAREDEPSAGRLEELEQTRRALKQQQADLSLEQQQIENMKERMVLLEDARDQAEQVKARLEGLYWLRQEQAREDIQEGLVSQLQQQRQRYLEQVAQITQRLQQAGDALSKTESADLQLQREITAELAVLTQNEIRLAEFGNELARLQSLLDAPETASDELKQAVKDIEVVSEELRSGIQLVVRKLELFAEKQRAIERRRQGSDPEDRERVGQEARLVGGVINKLRELQGLAREHRDRAQAIDARLREAYRKKVGTELLARQRFPPDVEQWQQLLSSVADAPAVIFYQVRLSGEALARAVGGAEPRNLAIFIGSQVLLLLLLVAARKLLGYGLKTVRLDTHTPFFREAIRVLLRLPRDNLWSIGLAAGVLIALLVFQIAPPGEQILATLVLIWLGVKLLVNVAWYLLMAPQLRRERQCLRLYRVWFLTWVSGGLTASLVVLGHLSELPMAVQNVFDWVFMLYFLLISIPVFQVRNLLVEKLAQYYGQRNWLVGLRFVSLILPVSLAVMSIVGLVGYLNLARTMGWYVMVFAGVLFGWLMCQGFLNDLAAWLKHRAFEVSARDWSAVREAVNSSHRVFTILLLLAVTIVLARAYGLGDNDFTVAWKVLALAVAGVIAVSEGVYVLVGYAVQRRGSPVTSALAGKLRGPMSFVMPIATAQILLPNLDFPEKVLVYGRHGLLLAQIAAVTWLLMRVVSMLDQLAEHRYGVDLDENMGARRAQTQIRVLRQALYVTVFLIGVACMLMTFPAIRQLGTGLLASAGAAGLVIGIAARPLFENLIAGIQIGLTQPMRLGDVVIVENEWGRIEEIAATYVVVRIWDKRRLVLPLKYFNETPFQNWTRSSADLLGTVFIHTDYTFPVEEGRKALKRILDESGLWDGKDWGLQVTNAKENSLELRALMSAQDANKAWDLRCHVREKLVEFIQKDYPEALPKTRAVLASGDAAEENQRRIAQPIKEARPSLA